MSSLVFPRAAAAVVLFVAAPIAAQSSAGSASAAPSSAAPSLPAPESAGRLKPTKWTYVARLMGSGAPQVIGFRTLELVSSTYNGAPAWLVVDTRQMASTTLAESLYVSRTSLESLHRAAHTPRGGLVAVYAHDSVRTTFDGEGGQTRVAIANEPGVLANMYVLELLLGSTPLSSDWRASSRLAAITPEESGVVTIETHVIGEESVQIPDGSFDCWLVALDVGKSRQRVWVRKSDGVVVKERIPVIGMPGGELELLLGAKGVGGGESPRNIPLPHSHFR